MLGRADPVGVDRLDVARVGLAAPTQEEALCCGVAAGDDLVRRRLAPAMFACSRVAGWSAHILEQKRTGRLFRPSAQYIGPAERSLASV